MKESNFKRGGLKNRHAFLLRRGFWQPEIISFSKVLLITAELQGFPTAMRIVVFCPKKSRAGLRRERRERNYPAL